MSIDSTTCPAHLLAECELHYVLSLSTKAERADYLDRAERCDGKASTDRLRRRVTEAWHAARAGTPIPCGCVGAPTLGGAVHHAGEQPVDGSFLDRKSVV